MSLVICLFNWVFVKKIVLPRPPLPPHASPWAELLVDLIVLPLPALAAPHPPLLNVPLTPALPFVTPHCLHYHHKHQP